MGYISNFKKFMKSEEKKASEMGANPQMVQEEDALLTDQDLIKIQDQKRALEKQLEAIKQQEETKIKELRTKAATDQAEAQKQAATAPATPAAPTT